MTRSSEAARNLIASHHAKFAREGCQLPGKPDDQITAQFLAVANWSRLSRMLHDLLTERQSTSFSWGWYVTVALQRIHGVSPEKVRILRETLRKTTKSVAADGDQKPTRTPWALQSRSALVSPIKNRCQASNGPATMNEQIRMLAARKSL